jgi:hypothetical protein
MGERDREGELPNATVRQVRRIIASDAERASSKVRVTSNAAS